MIFEYPKEFIVPVAFSEDLMQKKQPESMRQWSTLMIEEELLKKTYGEPIYNYNISQEISEDDTKKILDDIDEEYAASEALGMQV